MRPIGRGCGTFAYVHSLPIRTRSWSRWRTRGVTFVEEHKGAFRAMVAAFVADDPDTAYLVSMCVAPELRGTGVAVQLAEHVLGWAREHRRTRVVLPVERGNEPAARLYAKCGFVEIPQPTVLPYEPNADDHSYAYEL